MGKYKPLQNFLGAGPKRPLSLSYEQIELILGAGLPTSAHEYAEWWANEDLSTTTHVQCRAWIGAGFDAHPDVAAKIVEFRPRSY